MWPGRWFPHNSEKGAIEKLGDAEKGLHRVRAMEKMTQEASGRTQTDGERVRGGRGRTTD